MALLPPVVGILTADISEFTAKMGEAGAEVKGLQEEGSSSFRQFAKVGQIAFLAIAATAIAVGAESVKMASNFDAAMEQLHTQAGVPQADLAGLSKSVLNLAGKVGTDPDSLAAALYHVESSFASTGITGARALRLLTIAAEGAKVGHANLVDVTNALDASVVSGIPGVQNYSQAMGALNAIVGSGDMTMQDLSDAMGTGVLASAKVFGLSLKDVGAALATFGDNNIRGAKAGTDLKMVIQDLAKQGAPGVASLQSIGIASGQLGKDMQTGGLNKALLDLNSHLKTAGITGTHVGQFLEDSFTKKGGVGVAIMISQLNRFESKYKDIDKGAGTFGNDWTATTHQFQFSLQRLEATVQSLMIRLGNELIPIIDRVMAKIADAIQWFEKHKKVTETLAVAIGTVLVAAFAAATVAAITWVAGMVVAAAPVLAVIAALALLGAGIYLLVTHFHQIRQAVLGWIDDHKKLVAVLAAPFLGPIKAGIVIVTALIKHWGEITSEFATLWANVWAAVGPVVSSVVSGIEGALGNLEAWWDQHWQEIHDVLNVIWAGMKVIVDVAVAAIDAEVREGLAIIEAVWKPAWAAIGDVLMAAWDLIKGVVSSAVATIETVIGVALDLITGHWSKAWEDLKTGVSKSFDDIITMLGGVVSKLFDAAVNLGKAIVDGIIAGIEHAGSSIIDAIKDVLPHTGILGSAMSLIPGLAEGGIVTKPTLAVIGEAGYPEAVVPLKNGISADAGGVQQLLGPAGTTAPVTSTGGTGTLQANVSLVVGGQQFGQAVVQFGQPALLQKARQTGTLGFT